jgi:hypothetical protein
MIHLFEENENGNIFVREFLNKEDAKEFAMKDEMMPKKLYILYMENGKKVKEYI